MLNCKRHTVIAAVVVSAIANQAAAKETKFAWLSFAPELGYVFFSKGDLEEDYDAQIDARNGITVKGHIDLGGDKLAIELAPLYAWEGSSGLTGNLNAFGGEASIVYRFQTGSVFPSIGLGFHGAYLFATENVERGVELFGRVPLGLTWYFLKYVGLVLEGGFLFGGTGIRFKDVGGVRGNLSGNTEYAFSLGFDLLVGVRFP